MNEIKLYTFPQVGDTIQIGDEYLAIGQTVWQKVNSVSIIADLHVKADEVGFIRRPLKQVSQTELLEELGEGEEKAVCKWDIGDERQRANPHTKMMYSAGELKHMRTCPTCDFPILAEGLEGREAIEDVAKAMCKAHGVPYHLWRGDCNAHHVGIRKDVLCGSEFCIPQNGLEAMPWAEYEKLLVKERIRAIMEQREEVLSAFIAKYGFVQIQEGVEWSVRRMSDEEMQQRKDRHL